MSFAKKHSQRVFDFNTEDNQFISLEDLFEQNGAEWVYILQGFYINKKGKFDDSPVFVIEGYNVNIPSHMTEECIEILKDEEDVNDIKNGKVGFKIYQYHSQQYNKDCYNIEFVDIEPTPFS